MRRAAARRAFADARAHRVRIFLRGLRRRRQLDLRRFDAHLGLFRLERRRLGLGWQRQRRRRLDQHDLDVLRLRLRHLARDLLAHADAEADELDDGQRDRKKKAEQDQPQIARRFGPAQAALPGQPVGGETEMSRLHVRTHVCNAGGLTLWERLAGLALWNHEGSDGRDARRIVST